MFLAGLKFAVGLMVVTEWVIGWRKKHRRSKHGIGDSSRIPLERRNPVLLLIRYPAWVDESAESAHRESELR
jgi:hypothetical protein